MNPWGSLWSDLDKLYYKWSPTAWTLSSRSLSDAYVQVRHSSNPLPKNLPRLWMICSGVRTSNYVRAATQQILVIGQLARNDEVRSPKPSSQWRPPSRGQGEQRQSDQSPLTPLIVSYEKLLPMICELFDFRWPKPLKMDLAKRDHNRKCVYHKEHGHTIEQCKSLHYLVEKLIKVGHLKQYVRLGARSGETSRNQVSAAPSAPIVPRAKINYIHGGPLDEEYNSKQKRQRLLWAALVREHVSSIRPWLASGSTHLIDGVILFPLVDLVRVLQPHRDALILTLGIGVFDVRQILVDSGSSVDLLQVSVIKQMGFQSEKLGADIVRIQWGLNNIH